MFSAVDAPAPDIQGALAVSSPGSSMRSGMDSVAEAIQTCALDFGLSRSIVLGYETPHAKCP